MKKEKITPVASEVMKHKKKKKRTVEKSDHKHIYEPVLVKVIWKPNSGLDPSYHKGSRCSICGKISNSWNFFETEPIELTSGYRVHRMLDSGEILDKYKGLPIVEQVW